MNFFKLVRGIRASFLVLFFASIALVGTKLFLPLHIQKLPICNHIFSLLYSWTPGLIALLYAHKERWKLPIYKHPNRYLYSVLLITMGISLVAFLLTIPFESVVVLNPHLIQPSLLKKFSSWTFYFFSYYLIFNLVFVCGFLGSTLYWIGYVWEKMKIHGYNAIWIIAFISSLWALPFFFFFNCSLSTNLATNILLYVCFNFVLTPILLYYRVRGSIFLATLFYSSLQAGHFYLVMLFPGCLIKTYPIYLVIKILLLVIYSLFLKLYIKSSWDCFKENTS